MYLSYKSYAIKRIDHIASDQIVTCLLDHFDSKRNENCKRWNRLVMDADIVIEPIADSSPVVYIIVELCMEKYTWLQSFKLKLHQVLG